MTSLQGSSDVPTKPEVNGRLSFAGRRERFFLLAAVLLLCAFGVPFLSLFQLTQKSDLYSHILLIPFVSLYLVWIGRHALPPVSRADWAWGGVFFSAGAFALAGVWLADPASKTNRDSGISLAIVSWYCFFVALAAIFLGKKTLARLAFPIGFLMFIVPFPTFVLNGVETFLQHSSAAAAVAMLTLARTPVSLEGLDLHLSTITLTVAPECSGIHSSLVLFITSLLAGHLFLRSPWKRAALTLFVLPLAVVRNGFRIFTIAELCVHIGPEMIDHWIHRRGGPVFFALSLVPFLLFLIVLQRSEKAGRTAVSKFEE